MLKKISFYILLPFFFSCSMTQGISGDYLSFKNKNLSSEKVFVLPTREQVQFDDDYLQVIYNFAGAKLVKKEHQDESYYFVHIKGFGKMGQEGAPALPMHNDLLKVPKDSKVYLELVGSDYIEYDNFTIYPASAPISDVYGAKVPLFYKDANIYKKNHFFPEKLVEIVSNQVAREERHVRVQVRPAQLNPVTKKLRVYSKLVYRLNLR
ncbi:peptidase C25-like protein [Ancylomarina subtilis]|uniref:Peptidase C25-like protein n=1 Tax=Ancylomarina subtilis TaxID=1639035 RepID=A0A4Q7VIU6_9BACT|nr:C25 family peptidase propeptide domain-containing protein [Ancylomarina subtilis]RZT95984.1 peptidase C25-like protein [Ancylomarina subtilis]